MSEAERLTFRRFQCILVKKSDKAVLVEFPPRQDRIWIPRVCLSALTDRAVEDLPQMAEFEMQLVEWKAEDLNL